MILRAAAVLGLALLQAARGVRRRDDFAGAGTEDDVEVELVRDPRVASAQLARRLLAPSFGHGAAVRSPLDPSSFAELHYHVYAFGEYPALLAALPSVEREGLGFFPNSLFSGHFLRSPSLVLTVGFGTILLRPAA